MQLQPELYYLTLILGIGMEHRNTKHIKNTLPATTMTIDRGYLYSLPINEEVSYRAEM